MKVPTVRELPTTTSRRAFDGTGVLRPLIGLASMVLVLGLLGFRVNLTTSLPLGVYRMTSEKPRRGSVVYVCLARDAAELARKRGYLGPGLCPGGVRPLGKVVLATTGDVVTLSQDEICVNGRAVPNSATVSEDSRGRPLPHYDKEGVEMWVPMNADARRAVDLLLDRNPAIGDTPLFPRPGGGDRQRPKSWSRWHARDLHERAQRAAGYGYSCPECAMALGNDERTCPNKGCGYVDRRPRDPAMKLFGFHSYRRKWATEGKHLPLKDVAEAGGWLDTRSLEECCQQADEATLLQVVSEPRKLRETIAETIAGSSGT